MEAAAIRRAAGIRLAASPVKSDQSAPRELRGAVPPAANAKKGVTRARKPSTDVPAHRTAAAKGSTAAAKAPRIEVEVDAAAAEEVAQSKQEADAAEVVEMTVEVSDSRATVASDATKCKQEKVGHLLSFSYTRCMLRYNSF